MSKSLLLVLTFVAGFAIAFLVGSLFGEQHSFPAAGCGSKGEPTALSSAARPVHRFVPLEGAARLENVTTGDEAAIDSQESREVASQRHDCFGGRIEGFLQDRRSHALPGFKLFLDAESADSKAASTVVTDSQGRFNFPDSAFLGFSSAFITLADSNGRWRIVDQLRLQPGSLATVVAEEYVSVQILFDAVGECRGYDGQLIVEDESGERMKVDWAERDARDVVSLRLRTGYHRFQLIGPMLWSAPVFALLDSGTDGFVRIPALQRSCIRVEVVDPYVEGDWELLWVEAFSGWIASDVELLRRFGRAVAIESEEILLPALPPGNYILGLRHGRRITGQVRYAHCRPGISSHIAFGFE